MAWVGVVTDAGANLLGNYANNGISLEVDSIVTGTGYVATDALRRARTELVSPAGTGSVVSKNSVSGGVQFGLQVGPNTGTDPYKMKEVGLIVNAESDGTSTPVLFAYFNLEEGVDIPVAESFPDFLYFLSATLAIDNQTPFELEVDPDAFVSQAALEAVRSTLQEGIDGAVVIDQGVSNARKFLVVGSDGKVTAALVSMEGATSSVAGKAGLVPAPTTADVSKFLCGDGSWKIPTDTKYTGQSGQVVVDGTVIKLATAGTAGTKGPTADVTGNNNATVKIPQITTDAYGRVTTITERTLTLKNTTYSAGTGIAFDGTTIKLGTVGTAGTYGPGANVTGNNDATIKVPQITTDAYGRVTAVSERTLTLKNTTYTVNSTLSLSGTTLGLKSGIITAGTYGPSADVTGTEGTTIKIPQITVDTYGRVTGITLRTLTNKNSTSYLPLSGGTVTGATIFSNTTESSSTTTGAVKISGGLGVAKNIYAAKVYNAVWNDYAEFRKGTTSQGGWCMMECPDGWMRKSNKRLQAGCRLTSDTFGSCMGETDEAKTPIAVAGRVLAYPYEDIKEFHVGDAVCSAPNGKISKMSRREIRKWPDRIIGIVSEIPTYSMWLGGTKEDPKPIEVDGRIWIYVR